MILWTYFMRVVFGVTKPDSWKSAHSKFYYQHGRLIWGGGYLSPPPSHLCTRKNGEHFWCAPFSRVGFCDPGYFQLHYSWAIKKSKVWNVVLSGKFSAIKIVNTAEFLSRFWVYIFCSCGGRILEWKFLSNTRIGRSNVNSENGKNTGGYTWNYIFVKKRSTTAHLHAKFIYANG